LNDNKPNKQQYTCIAAVMMMRSGFVPATASAAAVAYKNQKPSSGTATALGIGRQQHELCSKRRHHHQHDLTIVPPPPPRTSTVLFWSNPVAWPIYGLLFLYLVTGYVVFRYGVSYLILKRIVRAATPWISYLADDAEARRAARYVGKLYRWLFGTTTTSTTTTTITTTDYKDGVKARSGRAVKAAAAVVAPRPDKLDN
jgi:hypothetical protein